MLFGSAFLCLFSAGASVLNYCLLTVAGPRIDAPLAALDRAMGFHWPAAMAWLGGHPVINTVLLAAYSSMLPQVALLMILLARKDSHEQVYRFCLAGGGGRPDLHGGCGPSPRPSAPFRSMPCRRRHATCRWLWTRTMPGRWWNCSPAGRA